MSQNEMIGTRFLPRGLALGLAFCLLGACNSGSSGSGDSSAKGNTNNSSTSGTTSGSTTAGSTTAGSTTAGSTTAGATSYTWDEIQPLAEHYCGAEGCHGTVSPSMVKGVMVRTDSEEKFVAASGIPSFCATNTACINSGAMPFGNLPAWSGNDMAKVLSFLNGR